MTKPGSPRSTDKTVPCAVPGCTRSSVFSRRAQLLAGAPEVEPPLPTQRCGQCEGVFRKLKDRPVRCGINGCDNKWTWPALEQIEAYAHGLPNDPPRRMCDKCKADFGAIADREVRCRTSGCKKTWTWTRSDQLDACLAGKATPKAPHRMCESCNGIYRTLQDVERPCRRSGCKGTWLDKRGGQLARAVRGKTGDPYPAVLRELLEGHRRARGPAAAVQDRQLHRDLDLDEGRRSSRRACARSSRSLTRRPIAAAALATAQAAAAAVAAGVLPAAAAAPREQGQEEAQADDQAARAPVPGLQRLPQGQEDAGDPVQAVRDADLLAAREPAADAPGRVGRAVAVRRLQARRDGGGARRGARGAAPRAPRRARGRDAGG